MRYRLPNYFRSPPRAVAVALALACLLPASVAQEKQPEKADEKTELADLLDDSRLYAIRATKTEAALKLHEPVMSRRARGDSRLRMWRTDELPRSPPEPLPTPPPRAYTTQRPDAAWSSPVSSPGS